MLGLALADHRFLSSLPCTERKHGTGYYTEESFAASRSSGMLYGMLLRTTICQMQRATGPLGTHFRVILVQLTAWITNDNRNQPMETRGRVISTNHVKDFRMNLSLQCLHAQSPLLPYLGTRYTCSCIPCKLPVGHATMPRTTLRETHEKNASEARAFNDEDKQLAPVVLSPKGVIYSAARHELP